MKIRILGVMTGTSCDGLDAACLEFKGKTQWKTLWSASLPYPAELRKRVLTVQDQSFQQNTFFWQELERDLSRWYGESLKKMIAGQKIKPEIIANHGQTVAHFPASQVSWQMGDAAVIAKLTELSVISRFRAGDLAAGGQGAPLVPIFHLGLAEKIFKAPQGVAIHNIGGISNLTYIGPAKKLIAFDTGPGNAWIDLATQHYTGGAKKYDDLGEIATRGKPDLPAIQKLLATHPYFKKPAPKSTGRDDFRFEDFLSLTRTRGTNLIATATYLTAETIALAYRNLILPTYPLKKIYLCGGGAKNKFLVKLLHEKLPQVSPDVWGDLTEFGLDPQMIEAQAFAYFGYLSLTGEALGGSWTGAQDFGPPGQITPGKNWNKILKILAHPV